MLDEVIQHLHSRPIKPIFDLCMSNENEIGLKVMCILDYYLEKSRLYEGISAHPKLLPQLLRFNSFSNFHFFEFVVNFPLNQWLLRCKAYKCEFIGPYKNTLEHMVLCHGRSESAELCQWCDSVKIRDHIELSTHRQCYDRYLREKKINEKEAERASPTIKVVYEQVRMIASRLGVLTRRRGTYQAKKRTEREYIAAQDDEMANENLNDNDDTDDGLSNEIYVTKTRGYTLKTINLARLDEQFHQAMRHFGIVFPTTSNGHGQAHEQVNQQYAASQNSDSGTSVPFDGFESYMQESDDHLSTPPPPSSFLQMNYQPKIHHKNPAMQHQRQQKPQQQRQRSQQSKQQPPHSVFPPWTATTSPEILNVAQFMISAVQNMRDEANRKQALLDIQQVVLQHSAKDLRSQLPDQRQQQEQ